MTANKTGTWSAPRGEGGFTLMELIIVTAVIAILAAISIPRLLEARFSAYEVSAAVYLRSVHQAEVAFYSRENRFAALEELKARKYLGPQGTETYKVTVTVLPSDAGYEATGTPLPKPADMRHFFVDASGVVRYNVGSPADETSQPQ